MSLGQVVPPCSSRAHSDEVAGVGKALEERAEHFEFNGGDLSDLGWLSQYKPFPTVPRSEEADAVAESVESSIQAQQRSALSQSCLSFNYNVSDCNSNGGGSAGSSKPICRWPKPAFSYSCLIAMALKKSETGQLPVHDIYDFMESNYPYFKTAPDGWKNSVRHNLSLNKWFVKVDTGDKSVKKKGCLWAINEIRRTAIENEISKWSRKNPHAILAAMAKPAQESCDVSMGQAELTPVSLAMPSNVGGAVPGVQPCPNMVMPMPQYSLQYPLTPVAAAAPTSISTATAASSTAMATATSAVPPPNASAGMAAVASPHMMAMSPFTMPVLWPGFAMPVPGGIPAAAMHMSPAGMHVPGSVQVSPGAIQVAPPPGAMQVAPPPGSMMMPPGMAMPVAAVQTAVSPASAPLATTSSLSRPATGEFHSRPAQPTQAIVPASAAAALTITHASLPVAPVHDGS